MQDHRNRWRGITAIGFALFATGLVTGCADQATEPAAPVSQVGDSPVSPKDTRLVVTGGPVAPLPSKPHYIVVERGQSLNGITHSHHVTPAALAAANHLQPPYKLKVGLRLVLPDTGRTSASGGKCVERPACDPVGTAFIADSCDGAAASTAFRDATQWTSEGEPCSSAAPGADTNIASLGLGASGIAATQSGRCLTATRRAP